MITNAYVEAFRIIHGLYEPMYSDDPSANRILHLDDTKRVEQIAVSEEVIQMYPPNQTGSEGVSNSWRCTVDFCAPTFDNASRLADVALEAFQASTRIPPPVDNPRSEFVIGTGYGRIRVFFTLELPHVHS